MLSLSNRSATYGSSIQIGGNKAPRPNALILLRSGPGSKDSVRILLFSIQSCATTDHLHIHSIHFPPNPTPCNGTTATFQNSSNGGFDVRGSAAPIVAWGQSTYSTTNLTAYNNLTTSITPLISVMFVNHTTDGNSTEGYSQSQLVCLRPSNVQEGSVKPSALPTSDGGQQRFGIKWLWLAVVGLTCISTVS